MNLKIDYCCKLSFHFQKVLVAEKKNYTGIVNIGFMDQRRGVERD